MMFAAKHVRSDDDSKKIVSALMKYGSIEYWDMQVGISFVSTSS